MSVSSSVLGLITGLALFLFGMKVMSEGLGKSTKGKLNRNLSKVTKNRFLAMIFGAGLTVAVQSSSAVTVILVGLVNSGILAFEQTIEMIMGSNIGTTLTAWILSLTGIESDAFWLQMLKPQNFAPVFALVGVMLLLGSKRHKHQNTGGILIGFAILMIGMTEMASAMKPLQDKEGFRSMLTAFENPLLAVLIGTAFTGVIQASAASVAILQAMSMSGGVTYSMAIPIVMGMNIGTCVTALLSSIGVNRNAKKVAVAHLSIKIIGTLALLVPFYILNAIFDFAFVDKPITPFMIAVVHSIFNVFTTALLWPFIKQLTVLTNKIVSGKSKSKAQEIILDDRLLAVPTVAVKEALEVAKNMCGIAKNTLIKATELLDRYDENKAREIREGEQTLDSLEDKLGSYMMKLSKIGIAGESLQKVTQIQHTISDFERIGDHAVNILNVAGELHDKKERFSEMAQKEVKVLKSAVLEILEITNKAFADSDLEQAKRVEPLEQVIDDLVFNIKANHVNRLQNGTCTIELGFALADLLTSYRRVSDHCSNVAVAVLETPHGTFDTHEYLGKAKNRNNEYFDKLFTQFSEKFSLNA